MTKLQAYPKYKPVEYDYVNVLPVDWKLLPNIAIFQERIERGFIEEELLSVTIGKGVIRQTDVDIKKDSSNEDKSKYKLIKIGDIAYNKMRMWQGALGYSNYQGISSPAYVILNPKLKINPKYFHYMFRTGFYTNYSKRFSYGIVDDQLSLRYTHFKRMYSIVPPLETQNDIVEYLDRKTKLIQEFISKKERLIELLEEQKGAIINKSVIVGLDKNVKFKKTFLGLIPKHWDIRRLGTIGKFTKGGNISRDELTTDYASDEDVSAILYGDIYTKYNIVAGNIINKISKKTASKSVKLIKGDLLFTGSGETKEDIGKCILFKSDEVTYAGGDVIIFQQKLFNNLFISYSQNSSLAKYQKYNSAKGEIIVHTYGSKLRDVFMPFPPSKKEQEQVVKFINEECQKIDLAISKAKTEIQKIKEYQESLISQVVTGELKVPARKAGKPGTYKKEELN